MEEDRLEEAAANVVRFCLFLENRKIMITKQMIKANVLSNYSNRDVDEALTLAKSQLLQVFGLDLVQVPKKSVVSYILVANKPKELAGEYLNILEATGTRFEENGSKNLDLAKKGLLMIILSCIALSNNKILHNDLVQLLEQSFYLSQDQLDIGSCLTEYVKYCYLVKSKPKIAVEDSVQYSWGPRAQIEYPIKEISKFIAKIYESNEEEYIETIISRDI